jgi:hypothetical protein
MCSSTEISRNVGCNLLMLVVEGRLSVWDPGREESGGVGWHIMNGGGMGIGKYINLGVWAEVGKWGALVLMAFYVIEFYLDWKSRDKLLDGLDDVVVGVQVTEWGGGVIRMVGKVIQDSFIVERYGERRRRGRRGVLVGV